MKNMIILIALSCVGSASFFLLGNSQVTNKMNTHLEYLIGEWKSEGFVTDAQGKQQFIEIKQSITKGSEATNEIKFIAVGSNPLDGFQYNAIKSIFYDTSTQSWYVKGSVKDKYTLNNKVIMPDNQTISYTFNDASKNLMRYTIAKENDYSFTETEEIWSVNGWDKTAWFRTTSLAKSAPVINGALR